jgi:ligand-binding SRPBCC domain-containing protein
MHTLDAEMWLPLAIEPVFAFFSDAGNLELLTPPWMQFCVLTPRPIDMSAGVRIDYRLRVKFVPIRWQSEITVWQPPRRFVDEQRRGPYRVWIHRHEFEERDGGTLVRDHVDYVPRGWPCARLINRLLVAPDLRAIFAYRHQKIRDLLAPGSSGASDQVVMG